MKVLIFGATGFIGSYVLKRLLNDHEVYAFKRRDSYPVVSLNKNPYWINKEIQNINESDFKNIDVVINLASAGVSPKKSDWETIYNVNVSNAIELIKLSHFGGVKRFITVGTCYEYGDEKPYGKPIHPLSSLNPKSLYAVSKTASFFLLNEFAKSHPIEFFYGRIFNTFGKGQFEKNLWPSLYNSAKNGQDFCIDAGEQIRDFIHVDEVAKYICEAVTRKDINVYKPLIVNIASGEGQKVKDFALNEWNKFNRGGKLIFKNYHSKNPSRVFSLIGDTIGL